MTKEDSTPMINARPIESIKSFAQEAADRFTVRRAIGMTTLALAVSGAGYATVEAVITDSQDESAAAPLIRADGFKDPVNLGETIDGGSVSMDSLRAGRCTFDHVQADLTYSHSRVDDVINYQIPLDRGIHTGNGITTDGRGNTTTVTVQNAIELRQAVPGLHC